MPANYSVIAENEMTYVNGGANFIDAIGAVTAPIWTLDSVKTFNTNIVTTPSCSLPLTAPSVSCSAATPPGRKSATSARTCSAPMFTATRSRRTTLVTML